MKLPVQGELKSNWCRNVLQMVLSQINILMKKAEIKENISQTP
jgi:hypothetical protein